MDMAKLKELHYDLDLAAVSAELTAESMTGVSQSLSAQQWRELATRFRQWADRLASAIEEA